MLVYHGQITHGLLQVLICYSHRIVHTTVLRTTRSWRTFNFDAFIRDLRESSLLCQPPTDVDQLFDCYHQTLQTLVDVHAPLKTVLVRANRTARWYDAECRCTKRETRKMERTGSGHIYQGERRHSLLAMLNHILFLWTAACLSGSGCCSMHSTGSVQ